MSIAREIASYLPCLRRFSRVLSGSQASGDAYVLATLEALIANTAVFDKTLAPRIAIYRLFLSMWTSTNPEQSFRGGAREMSAVDANLDALTPLSRQAFVLNAVEGFSIDDVALILNRPVSEASALVEQAGRDIAEQVATTVLIIEDEPIIALDIEAMVQELGHDVIGIARTHKEAVATVRARRPGLVLADIQLADGSSGLEAVNEILQSIDVPVIFITAFPERLLTGEKPEPAFLITKPFQPEAVKAAISQALFFDRRAGRKVA
ncbi:MAG: response regulator [Hyphomicrobiales bacterium]|nr:response regulator [Hyphomicrobiales bacterium]